MTEESLPGIVPPDARRVRRRAFCLAAVALRGFAEGESNPGAVALVNRARTWIRQIGLDDELEPSERDLIAAPPGSLSAEEAVNATWRSEGLGVLAWALFAAPLPPHDEQVDPAALSKGIGFLDPKLSADHEALPVRTADEIAVMQERLFALHWRLRQFSLQPKAMDFATFASTAWFGPLDIAGVALADGDLALDGVAIAAAPQARFRSCMSTLVERHRAINWLAGEDPTYSEIDTST
jgi:hypothetical protein